MTRGRWLLNRRQNTTDARGRTIPADLIDLTDRPALTQTSQTASQWIIYDTTDPTQAEAVAALRATIEARRRPPDPPLDKC